MLDTKQILKQNLETLLETRPDISRLNLSKQMKVADGTLGRIKYGTGNPTVEVLEQIAHFFKIQPWQMLVPDLGRQFIQPRARNELDEAIDFLIHLPSNAQQMAIVQIKNLADLTSQKVNEVSTTKSGTMNPQVRQQTVLGKGVGNLDDSASAFGRLVGGESASQNTRKEKGKGHKS